MITAQEIKSRQQKVREAMARAGADVLIAGASAQLDMRGAIRYITGYRVPVFEEFLVMPLNGPVMFFAHDASDADYAAHQCVIDDIQTMPSPSFNGDRGGFIAAYVNTLKPKRVAVIGFLGMSARFYNTLTAALSCKDIIDFDEEFKSIQMVKSPAEVTIMKAAAKLNQDTFDEYVKYIGVGKSEMKAIEKGSVFALEHGAEDLYWMAGSAQKPTIMQLSEARILDHIWEQGDYHYSIIEHSVPDGYFGELTNIVSLGRPKDEYAKAYKVIGEAQRAAAEKIRTGQTVSTLADTAYEVIASYGYYKGSAPAGWQMGHGQGMDVFELPAIYSGNETQIVPGMCFCVHPAIVLPDGAKITSCDSYVSTNGAAERLLSMPYEMVEV